MVNKTINTTEIYFADEKNTNPKVLKTPIFHKLHPIPIFRGFRGVFHQKELN